MTLRNGFERIYANNLPLSDPAVLNEYVDLYYEKGENFWQKLE